MSSISINQQRFLRRKRVRSVVSGSNDRPRLAFRVSARALYAQAIDDKNEHTVYAASIKKDKSSTMIALAENFGGDVAAGLKKAKIDTIVFDRGSKLYHGRVKAFAQKLRENGIKF